MNSKNIRLLIIAGAVAILFFWGCSSYNGLVGKDETVNKAWNNVEVQYQRRADLIPNLVETVKAVADREKGTFTEIVALRSGVQDAQKVIKDPNASQEAKMAAYGTMDQAKNFIMNIRVENYPNLKFPENFSKLQDELAGTENRVGQARTDFNEAVQVYNTSARRFPGNIFASIFGFKTKQGFNAQPGTENAPKVDFGK
jgi:LemA protein